jgi:phosphatidylglycerol:prolipoprotein diacylglycerol transferase
MYPDLSYLFHDLFGTAVDNWLSIFKTFGLMVALAVLTAAWFLRRDLRRRAELGQFEGIPTKVVRNAPIPIWEHLLNVAFGFFIGFKLGYIREHLAEMQADPSGVLLSTKGHLLAGILFGLLFGIYYFWQDRRNRQSGPIEELKTLYPHHRMVNISTVAVVSGVIGAKLFTVIEQPAQFMADPLGQLFSGDGWTIYGGLIGGFLGLWWYTRKYRIAFLPFLDAIAPAMMFAYGVGRQGCHLAGDGDWGIDAAPQPDWWFLPDWLWAYDYPRNVLNKGVEIADCVGRYCHQLENPVYPTSVYETLMAFTIGGILWSLRKRLTPIPGMLFALYVLFNGMERFAIEGIRVNPEHDVLGGFTQAEFIALILIAIGGFWASYLWRRGPAQN